MNKEDFRKVVKALRLDISDDEFNRMWERFTLDRELYRMRN